MRDHKKLRAFELAHEIVIMMYETGIAIPSHSVKTASARFNSQKIATYKL